MAALLVASVVSCKQEKMPEYNDVDRVYFYWATSTTEKNNREVSFGYDAEPKTDSTIAVRVHIMGRVSDVDRPVSAEVIASESTAKVGEDIEIVGGKVLAGADDGYIYVKMKNTEKLKTNTLYARLRLVPNEYFHADWNQNGSSGNTSGIEYYVSFDAKTDMPNLWKDAPVMTLNFWGPWSRVKEMTIYEVLGFDREFFTYDPATENAVEVLKARIPDGLALGLIATVNRYLRSYKEANDGNPLLDENGVEVKMASGVI
jgi:hypothetical protein